MPYSTPSFSPLTPSKIFILEIYSVVILTKIMIIDEIAYPFLTEYVTRQVWGAGRKGDIMPRDRSDLRCLVGGGR